MPESVFIFQMRAVNGMGFNAVANGFACQIIAGELKRSRRRVGVLIIRDNQDEWQFFDGGLIEPFVKRAGGSRAVADARRADRAGNFFETSREQNSVDDRNHRAY